MLPANSRELLDLVKKVSGLIMKKSSDPLKVFISRRDSVCDECHEELGHHAWIFLNRERGALCLACADLDHLLFLPAGDAALTRRAGKYSTLKAVVLEWSRTRKQYERQGLLVESNALEKAEEECLADNEARSRKRERAAERRRNLDEQYVKQFAGRIRELFPKCPPGRETVIAEHACLKYSGRIGRSADAREFGENAIRLAVIAHIRHWETKYDELLGKGSDISEARLMIEEDVFAILSRWGE